MRRYNITLQRLAQDPLTRRDTSPVSRRAWLARLVAAAGLHGLACLAVLWFGRGQVPPEPRGTTFALMFAPAVALGPAAPPATAPPDEAGPAAQPAALTDPAPEPLPPPSAPSPRPAPIRAGSAPRPRPRPAEPDRLARTVPSIVPPATSAPPTIAPLAEAHPAVIAPDWQAALARWIAAHRTYPDEARRDGAQGRVTVRLTADRTGRVLDVRIVQGAGSPVLDAAAEAMVRHAALPPFPASMPQDTVTVTIQVRYALAD